MDPNMQLEAHCLREMDREEKKHRILFKWLRSAEESDFYYESQLLFSTKFLKPSIVIEKKWSRNDQEVPGSKVIILSVTPILAGRKIN